MVQIGIPEDVFEGIKKVAPDSVSPDAYVTEVLRAKLALEERKKEFYQLSDENRAAMAQKGISEEEILADFESFRDALNTGSGDG